MGRGKAKFSSPLMGEEKGGGENIRLSPTSVLPPSARGRMRPFFWRTRGEGKEILGGLRQWSLC